MVSNRISYITGQGLPGYVPMGSLFKILSLFLFTFLYIQA